MSHVRTQIRQAVKAAIEGAIGTTHTVYASRKYSLNFSPTVNAIVDMRFANENSDYETMGDVLEREASLYVRVSRSGNEELVDDLLDDDAVLIEHVMVNTDFGDLIKSGVLKQTNFTDNADGDKPIAEVVLRFDLMYRTADNDVETART